MIESEHAEMLLVCAASELPDTDAVWGHGGWMHPREREALDWLALARLSGWGVAIVRLTDLNLTGDLSAGNRWVVIACDPQCLTEEHVTRFTSRLQSQPLLLLGRACHSGCSWSRVTGACSKANPTNGRLVQWTGPGPSRVWRSREPIPFDAVESSPDSSVWATIDGAPVITARRCGLGVIVTLGFHPSAARDADGCATALLKHLLICGAAAPVAWFDWTGTLVLRMDDPGGAQNVFKRTWCYPKLSEAHWRTIGEGLRARGARLSIAYVAGWVDDGDPARGTLALNGLPVERAPGRVYPSPLVQYRDLGGHAPGAFYDYASECAGIQMLRQAGLADVELHGYTHMHPDSDMWAAAPDRYESASWFRELGQTAAPILLRRPRDQHPIALGVEAFRRFFGIRPTTLISPGDEWTNDALERALEMGLELVDSYYLALRHAGRFCWCLHVCSPYLNEPSSKWFDSGLPVVGYFHDKDAALEGPAWIDTWLGRWQECGAGRMIDFRELAAALGRRLRVIGEGEALQLNVIHDSAPDLVRPLPIRIHNPTRALPSEVVYEPHHTALAVHVAEDGFGVVSLPADFSVKPGFGQSPFTANRSLG
jgi:hypothetical protein